MNIESYMLNIDAIASELVRMQEADEYLWSQATTHWQYRRRLKHLRREGTGIWWMTYDEWLSEYIEDYLQEHFRKYTEMFGDKYKIFGRTFDLKIETFNSEYFKRLVFEVEYCLILGLSSYLMSKQEEEKPHEKLSEAWVKFTQIKMDLIEAIEKSL